MIEELSSLLRQMSSDMQFMRMEISNLSSQQQEDTKKLSAQMKTLVTCVTRLSSGSSKFDLLNSKDERALKYDILNEIGRGRFSTVSLCQRKSDNGIFVMKQYPRKHRKKILAETNLLLSHISINPHPCILQYVEWFYFNEQLCVIMEDCNSEKLGWLIQQRENESFMENDILNWFVQIIEAEDYLQELNLPFNYIFDVNNVYVTKMEGVRMVKVRIRPLTCCNSENETRINQLRFSNVCSILFCLVGLSIKKDLHENRSQVLKFSNKLLNLIDRLKNGEIRSFKELTEVDILKQKREENRPKNVGRHGLHCSEMYETVVDIGRGTFGKVTKVWHRKKRQQYAMKELLIQVAMEADNSSEVQILRNLEHPNIIKFFEAFTNQLWNLCIVMEYCGRGNLHDRIKCQQSYLPFASIQIIKFFRPIAEALNFLHDKGYFHGDVKPQNVLLTLKGDVKLGDFGCCRLLSPGESVMSSYLRFGTSLYMAPEIYSQLCFGKKADVWALGCLLYELVALKPAFNYQPENVMLAKIQAGEYLPLSNGSLSETYEEAIKVMLTPNPAQRPRLMEILQMQSLTNDDLSNNACMRAENRDEWFDGLPPLIPYKKGMFPTIKWKASGEWNSMVFNEQSVAFLKLSLLVYPVIIWCRFTRNRNSLLVESREVIHFVEKYLKFDIQIDFNLSNETSPLKVRKSATLSVDRVWQKFIKFSNLPWKSFNPNVAPTIQITVKSVERMVSSEMSSVSQLNSQALEIVNCNENGEYPSLDMALLEIGFDNRMQWSLLVNKYTKETSHKVILPGIELQRHCRVMQMNIERYENDLLITARCSPRTDKQPRHIAIEMIVLVTLIKHDGSQEEMCKQEIIVLDKDYNQIMYFGQVQWDQIHPLIPPKVTLTVTKSFNESAYWWRGLSPHNTIGRSFHVTDWNTLPGAINWKLNWIQMIGGVYLRHYLCVPTLVVKWKGLNCGIIFHLMRDLSRPEFYLCGGLHWDTPEHVSSISVRVHCELSLTYANNTKFPITVDSEIIKIDYRASGEALNLYLPTLLTICSPIWKNLSLNTTPSARIRIECVNDT